MNTLILKPSSLGDVVQALPVLRLLKLQLPESRIYWWIETGLAPLLEGDPDLAGIVKFDRRRWVTPAHWAELWRSVHWMRGQDFDWVIDLQSLLRSGAFAWLANGKLCVGLDEPREGARGFYDLVARRASYYTHAVDWYLSVLPLLGLSRTLPFTWLPKQAEVAATLCKRWPIARDYRWIAMQPGARWLNKRWPVESFAAVVRRLAEDYPDHRFAVLGTKEDRPAGQLIAGAVPGRSFDLTGQIDLREMVEWIRLCDLMVSNDTGPMHVAAALGRPVVALFGPTEPRRTGPYGQVNQALQSRLACVPCMTSRCRRPKPVECLHNLTPDQVIAAVHHRLHNDVTPTEV